MNDAEPESILKTSVFADVQLTYKESGDGYSANTGSTTHAFLALKNHFKLCKKQGVDVIFMGGVSVKDYSNIIDAGFSLKSNFELESFTIRNSNRLTFKSKQVIFT